MISKIIKHLKFVVIIAIIVAFVWFLVVYPTYKFKQYESTVRNAAKRYYEINSSKLPTGNRVSTVSLQTLSRESYIKEDLYIPYTKDVCSPLNSWVKVTKNEDGSDYKYITYLECGAIKSTVDHKGPQITLKGEKEMSMEVNTEFKDPGIEKIYDKKDGNIDVKETVISGNVDSKNVGDYKITYSAVDKLGNKTVEERIIHVVNTLRSQVENLLGKEKRFKGNPEKNYIKVSNMNYRIVGLDDNNNVIIVAEHPVSYINYSKIDKWLNEYYYNILSKKTKKMIVESEYCKGVEALDSTKCSNTTTEKVYYPSVVDINLAQQGEENFMKTDQLSWINAKNGEITTTGVYNGAFYNELYKKMDKNDLSTIRPMLTINGKLKITSGDGTFKNPYKLKDHNQSTGKSKASDLSIGDLIFNKGTYFRVIKQESDGTTKVISDDNVKNTKEIIYVTNVETPTVIYNPKKSKNIASTINNQTTKYIDKSIFTIHEIEVPIYKGRVIYGTETKKEKYKVLFSAPNIFEMYSAHSYGTGDDIGGSCWFINSSLEDHKGVVVNGYGDVIEMLVEDDSYQYRVVAYLKEDLYISSGDGSYKRPYTLR